MNRVIFEDWGLIDYKEAWERQQERLTALVEAKRLRRKGLPAGPVKHHLIFCSHPPVYTLGRSGSVENLLYDEAARKEKGIQYYKINRGGDITYHGPGQVVGYPIFDLDHFFTDVHRYIRYLEEVIIRTLADYGIKAGREKEYTGVWIDGRPKRKICAIGVHLSRWVTMHGFAFNANTDLQLFDGIIPCGIRETNKSITSLAEELGIPVAEDLLKEQLKKHFQEVFDMQLVDDFKSERVKE